jgi:dTDP-4-dehydrorhamnose 3,5-epimerase
MTFKETTVSGAFVLEPQRIQDDRGYFGRIWCRRELSERRLKADIVQSNVGFSHRKGTLRGLHFQRDPHAEVKIVRCTRGSVFDVLVDLRPGSPSYRRWHGVELNPENGKMVYVPEGCAQGYMTLTDDAEIYYHTTAVYAPEFASGVRYDDPAFGIVWPLAVSAISQQDQQWPHLSERMPN